MRGRRSIRAVTLGRERDAEWGRMTGAGARERRDGAAMRSLTFAFSSLRAILKPRPASSAARSRV